MTAQHTPLIMVAQVGVINPAAVRATVRNLVDPLTKVMVTSGRAWWIGGVMLRSSTEAGYPFSPYHIKTARYEMNLTQDMVQAIGSPPATPALQTSRQISSSPWFKQLQMAIHGDPGPNKSSSSDNSGDHGPSMPLSNDRNNGDDGSSSSSSDESGGDSSGSTSGSSSTSKDGGTGQGGGNLTVLPLHLRILLWMLPSVASTDEWEACIASQPLETETTENSDWRVPCFLPLYALTAPYHML